MWSHLPQLSDTSLSPRRQGGYQKPHKEKRRDADLGFLKLALLWSMPRLLKPYTQASFWEGESVKPERNYSNTPMP